MEINEGSPTLDKRSFLIAIKFKGMSPVRIGDYFELCALKYEMNHFPYVREFSVPKLKCWCSNSNTNSKYTKNILS